MDNSTENLQAKPANSSFKQVGENEYREILSPGEKAVLSALSDMVATTAQHPAPITDHGGSCSVRPSADVDPYGREAHEPGAKLDAGKTRPGLVFGGFAGALELVALVGTYGADKYTENGWQSVPDGIRRYTDALYRHLMKWQQGEYCDQESGIHHLAHAAWNVLAILELHNRDLGN